MTSRVVGLAALIVVSCLLRAFAEAPWSGVEPGGTLPAYNPQHLAGPDRGTRVCPV